MKDFKVRCVSNDGNPSFYTVGKVYKVSTDGTLVTNTGFKINQGFKTVKDINEFSSSTFELVEDKPSFKVRCVEVGPSNNGVYIKDKIYEIIDGILVSERGCYNRNGGRGFKNVEEINTQSFSKFELVTEPKQFTKADLRTGMRVKNREGEIYLVVKDFDIGYLANKASQDPLKYYNEDLINNSGIKKLDIVEVYEQPEYARDIFNLDVHTKILYQRTELPKMTHKEIETELGHEFEYVKE